MDDIEVLHYIPFKGDDITAKIDKSIANILSNNHAKECPYCAEIIKERAKVCRYCLKDLEDTIKK